MTARPWTVEVVHAPAATFHARPLPEPAEPGERREPAASARRGRHAWVAVVPGPALVLGSAQPAGHIDAGRAAAAGLDVVRRRSGGGAVLVEPGDLCWVDLVIERGDPLWDDDIGRATWWVGEAWAATLAGPGIGLAGQVHRGPLERNEWSPFVCFAGLGAGEVSVDGRKVVGVSQRRVRRLARFQTAMLIRWRPERLVELLDLPDNERLRCLAEVGPRAAGVEELAGPGLPGAAELARRFVANLPA